jgi:hypothetical protein
MATLCCAQSAYAQPDTNTLTGKLLFEDGGREDRERSPAVMLADLATLKTKILVAPGMEPRWFPNGQEVAYFLPSDMRRGVVHIPESREKLVAPEHSEHWVILPGHTITIDLEGNKRREMPDFLTDIHPTGEFALMIRPGPFLGGSWSNRGGDLILRNLSTKADTVLISAVDLHAEGGLLLRRARWIPGGRSIILQAVQFSRTPAGGSDTKWSLHRLDLDAPLRKVQRLPVNPGMENSGPRSFVIAPDGSRVAYSVIESEELWSFDLSSGRNTSIDVGELKYRKSHPRFSPDGKHILFNLTVRTGEAMNSSSFWVAPATGGSADRLFSRNLRHLVRFWVLREGHGNPDWWQPR